MLLVLGLLMLMLKRDVRPRLLGMLLLHRCHRSKLALARSARSVLPQRSLGLLLRRKRPLGLLLLSLRPSDTT
jgi:hypothetical protein